MEDFWKPGGDRVISSLNYLIVILKFMVLEVGVARAAGVKRRFQAPSAEGA